MLKEGEIRIPSGCAISGIINRKGKCFSGQKIIESIATMHDRSNGLGGGFAAYGIYPDYKEHYALHVFYEDREVKEKTEILINRLFALDMSEKIPTAKKVKGVSQPPLIWRYFVKPKRELLEESDVAEKEFIFKFVMDINSNQAGAYVFSSGQNMGTFKGVGYPEDIGEFYQLDDYSAYIWTAHGRFPTNTPGWWGGAHPFSLLDWSIVHNGEISSYGANKAYLENFGYQCPLQTDTEAITYIFDLLLRKRNLPLDVVIQAIAAPFWEQIQRMPKDKQEMVKAIRCVYGSLLINGPFSIILGSPRGIVVLNDRIKLRSLVAAEKDEYLYAASEESAIREVCAEPDKIWSPKGGEPIVAFVEGMPENLNFETADYTKKYNATGW